MSGIGGALNARASESFASPLAPKQPHFPAKAKHVIHIFATAGCRTWTRSIPKPSLAKYAGKNLPMENLRTERKTGAAYPSPFKFQKYGKSGIEVSELFSNVAESIDDIAVIRSIRGRAKPRASLLLMNCGEARLVCGQAWDHGLRMAWALKTRTCPGLSRCAPAVTRSRNRRTGRADFCRAFIRRRISTRSTRRSRS